ncbi:ATP-dependent zinc protease family protein [Sediminitomix flava]|uniref:Retropepsin-like aspartic endopeptidase domain-containing protein n=1 Tax=Sediminitomix flava TaxID=379075 RepID=A0A315Z879_SEDFL|nr:RimK/LysX family protein [Sediminitomix flava]PWJ40956.1 hypothetical protein BC781_104222 [Sediminitomix flava]
MEVIGRTDKIDLPTLGLFDIETKIDTGAYGCALHCHHIEVVEKDNKKVLSFMVLDPSHPEYDDKVFYTEHFTEKDVKSSSGESEHRFVIQTVVELFHEQRTVEFSLTNRQEMKYPVLMGRKFLAGHYVVNVQLKDLSYKTKTKKK